MSVEAPTGGVSAPAISTPPISAPSAEGPTMPSGGRSSFEGISSMPQLRPASPMTEGPARIGQDIFTSDFPTVAFNKSVQLDRMLGTQPFQATSDQVSESVVHVDLGELSTIAQNPDISLAKTGIKEVTPNQALPQLAEKVEQVIFIQKEVESLTDQIVETQRNEYVKVDLVQAAKVEKLFKEVGVSEETANTIVTGILEDKGIDVAQFPDPSPDVATNIQEQILVSPQIEHAIQISKDTEILGQVEELNGDPAVQIEPSVQEEAGSLDKSRVGSAEEEQEPQVNSKKKRDKKGKITEIEVDEKAQEARMKAIRKILEGIGSQEQVSGQQIAPYMRETPEQKSELLPQLGLEKEKDGSFEEDKKQIRELGEYKPAVLETKAAKVLEENRPVRIVEMRRGRKADEKERDKVLAFAKPLIVLQQPART